jgi:hypothetical protein
MRVQDDVGRKADTDEMFNMMNSMGDTLRSTLSKTPQLNKLRDILKKKADKDDISALHDEMENMGTGQNLTPALTRSTCLTCNRPLGKSVTGSGATGEDNWRRPPTSVAQEHRYDNDGREINVLNNTVPISNLKRLNDSNSSPTTVSTLVGDPRKMKAGKSLINKKMTFMGNEEGGSTQLMEKNPERTVSRYPGRLLPPKIKSP